MNWPEYDAALVRRGSLAVWFTEEAVAAWHAPATGERAVSSSIQHLQSKRVTLADTRRMVAVLHEQLLADKDG